MELLDYANNVIKIKGDCAGCAFANHEFSLPCKIAYEDDFCTVAQDWELPIVGMLIVSPKKHISLFDEMSSNERNHLLEIVNKVMSILRKNKVVENFNVVFEEKKNRHFHIWIFPRDGWKEKGIDPIKDIRELTQFALKNNKNEKIYSEIKKVSEIVGQEMSR